MTLPKDILVGHLATCRSKGQILKWQLLGCHAIPSRILQIHLLRGANPLVEGCPCQCQGVSALLSTPPLSLFCDPDNFRPTNWSPGPVTPGGDPLAQQGSSNPTNGRWPRPMILTPSGWPQHKGIYCTGGRFLTGVEDMARAPLHCRLAHNLLTLSWSSYLVLHSYENWGNGNIIIAWSKYSSSTPATITATCTINSSVVVNVKVSKLKRSKDWPLVRCHI